MNVQHVSSKALLGLSIAVIAGGAAMALRQAQPRRQVWKIYYPRVRDAGPANMMDPPDEWDSVDEAIDQSFPASDPPCHCMRSSFR